MADAFDPSQVVVGDVEVRLARPDERRRWDALIDRHHYLGFRQFAGRGRRHVALWCGHWLALLGWQSGAFKCAPRDRWLGWHRSVQFRRLHLIGNNTRFLILPEGLGIRNLASRVLGRSRARRRRQAHSRCQPPHRRGGVLRDGHPGHCPRFLLGAGASNVCPTVHIALRLPSLTLIVTRSARASRPSLLYRPDLSSESHRKSRSDPQREITLPRAPAHLPLGP